jgi:radical SAM superfamily enzyme YgiQ (UPF0313 family)
MERVDCIFLHVPKLTNAYRPLGRFTAINFLPMGLLALADRLHRLGLSTQVVHLGIEWIEDKAFSILSYLREKDPRIIALDLHWHHQSYDVTEMVKQIKAALPQAYILLGGFTASFFHEEIMKTFPEVDGIIRGEAEEPLAELAQAIREDQADFFSVPNLTWRRRKKVLVNPLSYVASEEDLNRLCFTRFSLLKNYPTYIRSISQPYYVQDVPTGKRVSKHSPPSPVFPLPVGRGCPVQCTWCSGGFLSQETVSGRNEVIFRAEGKVIETIQDALAHGYEIFHIKFDPYPEHPDFYLGLFSRLRKEKVRMECIFESYGLPTVEFVQSFKESFPGPKSSIVLSPHSGPEGLRMIHKGYAFTNDALLDCLRHLKAHRVFTDLHFTLGAPFETEDDYRETIRLQRKIRRLFPNVRNIRTVPLEMEPGSPWHTNPGAYGVKTSLRSFTDFVRYHSERKEGFSSSGYWIPSYFRDAEDEKGFEKALQEIQCRHFCFLRSAAGRPWIPIRGKLRCDLAHWARKMKGWVAGES